MTSPTLHHEQTTFVTFVGTAVPEPIPASDTPLLKLAKINPRQTLIVNSTIIKPVPTPVQITNLRKYTQLYPTWTTLASTSLYTPIGNSPQWKGPRPGQSPPFDLPPPVAPLPIWGFVLISIAAGAFVAGFMFLLWRHRRAGKTLPTPTLSPTYNPRDFGQDHAVEWTRVENDGRYSRSQLEAMYASWLATQSWPNPEWSNPNPEAERESSGTKA